MGLRIPSILLVALFAGGANAFVPQHAAIMRTAATVAPPPSSFKSARFFGVDPNMFHDAVHQTQSLSDAFGSISLSDAADAVGSVANDASGAVGDVANEVATNDNGFFGFLTEPIGMLLQLIHTGIMAMGVTENSWGVTIIAMTVLIKLLTFPLTKTQLESTNKMQVRSPLARPNTQPRHGCSYP
jgi:YidC/Oxa1 family membrane protein insertase